MEILKFELEMHFDVETEVLGITIDVEKMMI